MALPVTPSHCSQTANRNVYPAPAGTHWQGGDGRGALEECCAAEGLAVPLPVIYHAELEALMEMVGVAIDVALEHVGDRCVLSGG